MYSVSRTGVLTAADAGKVFTKTRDRADPRLAFALEKLLHTAEQLKRRCKRLIGRVVVLE